MKNHFNFNHPAFWFGLTLAAFIAIMTLSEPLPFSHHAQAAPAAASNIAWKGESIPVTNVTEAETQTLEITQEPTPSQTPLPPELVANREQTNGVILGTVFLVMIVVIGTLSGISRLSNKSDDQGE